MEAVIVVLDTVVGIHRQPASAKVECRRIRNSHIVVRACGHVGEDIVAVDVSQHISPNLHIIATAILLDSIGTDGPELHRQARNAALVSFLVAVVVGIHPDQIAHTHRRRLGLCPCHARQEAK